MGTRGASTASGVTTPVVAVRRERLLQLLDHATQRRLTLVVAPAGYGKTTAVAHWAERTDDPLIWISIRPVHEKRGRLTRDLSRAFALLDGARSAAVVLDDFHLLADSEVLDECADLIERAPVTTHVVLVSRSDPPPRFLRLRLSDALAEVGVGELAFTHGEAAELLERSVGESLSGAQVDSLLASTRGWAMGLEFAGRAHRNGGDVDQFGADDGAVHEYLTTEVLGQRPQEMREFLLRTSVLERMSGSLCDFVNSGRRSQAMLEDLESAGAFVTALDSRWEWFEYHPMFRAVLRRHLGGTGTDTECELLRRAGEWHLMRGDLEDGVRCLIDANAGDEVIEAAFTHGAAMFEQHRVGEVAGWIERASCGPLQAGASATLLEAASLLFANSLTAADDMLESVRAMPEASGAEVLVGDLLRAHLALAQGATDTAVRASNRVLRTIDSVDEAELPNLLGLTGSRADVAAGALVARAGARLYDARLAAARRDVEAVGANVHSVWRAWALGIQALIEAWSGNLAHAEELGMRALLLADSLSHGTPSRTTASLAIALVARHRNDLERAVTLLEDVESGGGTPVRAVAVWVASERAHIALASDVGPAGLAALAGQLASAHPSLPTGVLARRLTAEAQLLIASDDLEGAEGIADLGMDRGSSELTATRVRLAVERSEMARARATVDAWPDQPEPRVSRERRLWTAILDHLDGNETEACAGMAAVIAEAEPEGDIGLFQAAGKYALGPARALYRAHPTVFLRALVDQPFIVGRAKPAKGLAEQLTDREYMVLVHLPGRQSNAEIAQRLGVSLNTVKTHLKHIYRKLDALGRSEAVDAAERLHLL